MKILLDECLPTALRQKLPGHECETVPRAGLAGTPNGEWLALAERAGWQVLLTMDRAMPYQQNLSGRAVSTIVIRSKSNRLQDLLPVVPAILTALKSLKKGRLVRVG